MEFWIIFNDKNAMQLPVGPSEFSMSNGKELKTVNINSLGEVVMIGNPTLCSVSLSSFFPAEGKGYSFLAVNNPKPPYQYVDTILSQQQKQEPVRLIITKTPINKLMVIDNFEYGEKDGTGDVYYSLSFKEYREIKVIENERSGTVKSIPKTYTVKKGDTLPKIAQKLYGDKSQFGKLVINNKIKGIKKIHDGAVGSKEKNAGANGIVVGQVLKT